MDICFPYCTKFAIIFLELSQHERRGAFCDTERSLNIIWPVTSQGQMAFSRCPVGSRGRIGSNLQANFSLLYISYIMFLISYLIFHISYLTSHISFLLSCFSYISPNYHIPYLFLTSDFSPLLSCISYLAHRISSHIYQILTLTFHISCHSLFNVTSLKFRIPCPNYQVSLRESVWKFSAKAHLNGVSLISVNASRIK